MPTWESSYLTHFEMVFADAFLCGLPNIINRFCRRGIDYRISFFLIKLETVYNTQLIICVLLAVYKGHWREVRNWMPRSLVWHENYLSFCKIIFSTEIVIRAYFLPALGISSSTTRFLRKDLILSLLFCAMFW